MDKIKQKEKLKEIVYLILNNINSQYGFLRDVNFRELAGLNKPCHLPSIRYSLDEMFMLIYSDRENKILNIMSDIIKINKFKMFQNKYTLFLILSILTAKLKNNIEIAKEFTLTLALQFYASLMYKYIKYCDNTKFDRALNLISKLHGFKKYGIGGFIKKLSEVIINKHFNYLTLKNTKSIIKFVFELRHRINQSLKSFANVYYKLETISKEPEEANLTDRIKMINNIINEFLQSFAVIKELDTDLIRKINTRYHINISYLIRLFKDLQDTDYIDELKIIIGKLLTKNNISKLLNQEEWEKEITNTLKRKGRREDSVRKLIENLINNTPTFSGYFNYKNEVTKRRVINIIIEYFMRKVSDMSVK